MKIKILFFLALPFLAYASEHGGTNYDIVERTLNFLLFFAILVYFAAKPLKALYQSRIDRIANKLESIQEKLRESKAKKDDVLKRVEEAKQNANALIETAKKEAVNLSVLSSSYFSGKQISNYAFSVDIAGGKFQNLVKKSHFAVNASGKSLEKLENLTEENIKKDTAMGLLVLEKAMCLAEK